MRRLTFVELAQLAVAWAQREEERKAELAWILSWVVSPHLRQPRQPDAFLRELLGDAAYVRRLKMHIAADRKANS